MTIRSIYLTCFLSFSFIAVVEGNLAAQDKAATEYERSVSPAAKAEIRSLVDRYMQSIDDANPKLGATVWSPTPDVSFINPLGHEVGWDRIVSEVYTKLMGQTFSKRTLKNVGDVSIHVYGDAAVVEFDWDFVAIARANGQTVHTTGRESQLYVKLPGAGWRLVHVHYSGPPVSGAGAGF
jgi:ketosteroid isomerase-like protein